MTDDERARMNQVAVLHSQVAEAERKLAGLRREQSQDELNQISAAMTRYDSVAQLWGHRALPPVPGEDPLNYRKRLAKDFQKHSDQFKAADLARLDAATFQPIEEVIYNDAKAAAWHPDRAAPGTLIPVQERDAAGRLVTKYTGDIGAFMAPFMTTGVVGYINRNPPPG